MIYYGWVLFIMVSWGLWVLARLTYTSNAHRLFSYIAYNLVTPKTNNNNNNNNNNKNKNKNENELAKCDAPTCMGVDGRFL